MATGSSISFAWTSGVSRNMDVQHTGSNPYLVPAGKLHISARRGGELLPFAGSASTNRRLIQPFKGHNLIPTSIQPRLTDVSNAAQAAAALKAAKQPPQQMQMPNAGSKHAEPSMEASKAGKVSGGLPRY